MEAIILKCNLFRIYWGRSTAFIYSCSSLIYSRGTCKTYTRKYFGLTKYPQKKLLTHKIPTRKKFDPRNTHEKKFRTLEDTVARWRETNETHDGTRPTEFSTLNYLHDLACENNIYIQIHMYTEEAHTDTAPLYCTIYCEAHRDITTFTEVTWSSTTTRG